MNSQLILAIIADALDAAQLIHDEFVRVHGRPPTVDEWRALRSRIKSPDDIEREVRAQFPPRG